MKHLLKSNRLLVIASLAIVLLATSCEKDAKIPPTIDFTTAGGYTSADGSLARNTAFKIGITAQKTEGKDVLKTWTVTRSYDGAAETTIDSQTLSGAQGDLFTKDYPLTTRNQAGTEKYTFTVTNRDGLITTKSITITVP
jgi:hypothetical protein